jgi:hypothetical protein
VTDFIARHLARLLSLLFPSTGQRCASPEPEPTPVPCPQRPHPSWPEHKSPYALEAAEQRPFEDTLSPVRPYVLARPYSRPESPEEQAGAERRWAVDMALRGIDVGPAKIHGVHMRPGSRTLRVAVAI